MQSRPLLLTGPKHSGKTHIAMAMMALFPEQSVKTDAKDDKRLIEWASRKNLKLMVIEDVIGEDQLRWLHSMLFEPTGPALIFTSLHDLQPLPGFIHIKCTYNQ